MPSLHYDSCQESRSCFLEAPKNFPKFLLHEIKEVVEKFRQPVSILFDKEKKHLGVQLNGSNSDSVLGVLPGLYPEWLGDRSFQETHAVVFPYVVGEMANGIASARMVIASAKAGLLGFFGAAGLSLERLSREIDYIQENLIQETWGSNLIHSPQETQLEQASVDLYLKKKVRRISASAFMNLTQTVVQYACTGLYEDAGRVCRQNYVFAKISRPETARHFMSPPPKSILDKLFHEKKLTKREVELAQKIPVSEDITVEADSAGHTDNQVLSAILPTIIEIRNSLQTEYKYKAPIRVGAAGGIGSPSSVAGAFAMGAAYILTGTVNQVCVESDIHVSAKKMLETVNFGDMMMCAASDMFEQGVKLQVMKRGTLYPVRANWLYELYRTYSSIQDMPKHILERLEKDIFRRPLSQIWEETQSFWLQRDPVQVERANKDPKHFMALTFRYYLGLSSKWAIQGLTERQYDYQIWCGPSQAVFNQWVKGSFLADLENRTVQQVAYNLLEGACQISRAQQLRSFGVPVPLEAYSFKPRKLSYDLSKHGSEYVQ